MMGTNSSLSARISGSSSLPYSLAIAAVLVADSIAFVLLVPAVAFSAWYCGVWPSIMAIVLSLAGAMYVPFTALHPFRVPTLAKSTLLIAFLFSSIVVLTMAESRRRQNETLR